MTPAIALLGLLAASGVMPGALAVPAPAPKTALWEFFGPGDVVIRAICVVMPDRTGEKRLWCTGTASGVGEHEFRVISIENDQFGAINENQALDAGMDDGTLVSRTMDPDDPNVGAEEGDLSYHYFLELMQPADDGRATPGAGDEYVVRFGTDEQGLDCTIKPNANTMTGSIDLYGDCGADWLPTIITAEDILYIELYLSGNAENILYRFNFYGITPRYDSPTANSAWTADKAVEPTNSPLNDRTARAAVSRPSTAVFFLSPLEIEEGTVKLCERRDCTGSDDPLKEFDLFSYNHAAATYDVKERPSPAHTIDVPIDQLDTAGLDGARYFAVPLPPDFVEMPGSANVARTFFVEMDPTRPPQPPKPEPHEFGIPKGSYGSSAATAAGQMVLAGVNVADGHLVRQYDDVVVPEKGITRRFTRTYNNQRKELSPLGAGWMHNHEGYIDEEVPGRYQVVLEGQAYDFSHCEVTRGDANEVTAISNCVTDKNHGGKLTITTSNGDPNKPARYKENGFVAEYEDGFGTKYIFDKLSTRGDVGGSGRRFLLTQIDDPLSSPIILTYLAKTDWVETAARAGGISFHFQYGVIPDEDPKPLQQVLTWKEKPFRGRYLRQIEGRLSSGTPFFREEFVYDVEKPADPLPPDPCGVPPGANGGAMNPLFVCRETRDETGALRRDMKWMYTWPSAGTLVSSKNHMETEKLALVGETNPNVYDATYTYATATGEHYKHLEGETKVVTTAVVQGESYGFAYKENSTEVTWPTGSTTTVSRNDFGNATSIPTPCGNSSATWESSSDTGKAVPTEDEDRVGDKQACEYTDRLQPTTCTLTVSDSDVKPVSGLNGAQISFAQYDDQGRPEQISIPAADGSGSVTITNVYTGEWLTEQKTGEGENEESLWKQPVSTDGQPDDDGTDGAGKTLEYSATFDADFGQVTDVTRRCTDCPPEVTAPGNQTKKAVTAVKRLFTYDKLGRTERVVVQHEKDGAFTTVSDEAVEYDALNRPVAVARIGGVTESFSVTYAQAGDKLTVTTTGSYGGTSATRTWKYKRGLLEEHTDRHGTTTTYDRGDDECLVASVTESLPGLSETRVSTLTRSGAGRPQQLAVSVNGDIARYLRFDLAGNVAEVDSGYADDEEAGRFVDQYLYNLYGQLEEHQYGDLHKLVHAYDAEGELLSTKSFETGEVLTGATTKDKLGRVTKETRKGITQEYVYDALGRVVKMTRTAAANRSFASGSSDIVLTELFEYDDENRTRDVTSVADEPYMDSCLEPAPGGGSQAVPCWKKRVVTTTTRTAFDVEARPDFVLEVHPTAASQATYTYDAFGRTTTAVTSNVDSTSATETFSYPDDRTAKIATGSRTQELKNYADGKLKMRCEPDCGSGFKVRETYEYDGDWPSKVTFEEKRAKFNDAGTEKRYLVGVTETWLRVAELEYDDFGRPVRERQELCLSSGSTPPVCQQGSVPQSFEYTLTWTETESGISVDVKEGINLVERRELDANRSWVSSEIHLLPGGSTASTQGIVRVVEYRFDAAGTVGTDNKQEPPRKRLNFIDAENDIVEENEAGLPWRVRHTTSRTEGSQTIENGGWTLVGWRYLDGQKARSAATRVIPWSIAHSTQAELANGDCVDKPAKMEDLWDAVHMTSEIEVVNAFFSKYDQDPLYNNPPCDIVAISKLNLSIPPPDATQVILAWTALSAVEAATGELLGLVVKGGIRLAAYGARGATAMVGRGASRLTNGSGAMMRRPATVNMSRWTTGPADELVARNSATCRGGSCFGGTECFVAGTGVLTRHGLVPIEEVVVGDRVWSRDPETGEESWQLVTRTYVTTEKEVLELELIDEDTGASEVLGTTAEHPFRVEDDRWVVAGDLAPGDLVFSAHGGWLRVGSSTWTQERATVYNFEVDGTHTYFVGESAAWVHNSCGYEAYYRAMSREDYARFLETGRVPATTETFISPSQAYASKYRGVLVEFQVASGTASALKGIGVRAHGARSLRLLGGDLPLVRKGWGRRFALFKPEGDVVNIGLGRGRALDVFNDSIRGFKAVGFTP